VNYIVVNKEGTVQNSDLEVANQLFISNLYKNI